MRRLPGPAFCRLSEGDQTPEALYELFRDWQRTHTQSSVTALRSLRQQMDVWFCRTQEPMPRGILLRVKHPGTVDLHALRACPGHPCLNLTNDLHGCRQSGSKSAKLRRPEAFMRGVLVVAQHRCGSVRAARRAGKSHVRCRDMRRIADPSAARLRRSSRDDEALER
jgi:hypothetical protein